MRLLLAIDSSTESESVVREVAARPWPQGTSAAVLTVVNDAFPPETLREASEEIKRLSRERSESAHRLTARAAQELWARDIPAEGKVRFGNPLSVVLGEAESWSADLILVGACGHHGLTGFLLGSVARDVVLNAPCSVEVVRPRSSSLTGGAMKVLLATDGSEYSAAAARSVAERPWPAGSEFFVVSVVNQVAHTAPAWRGPFGVGEITLQDDRRLAMDAVGGCVSTIGVVGLTAKGVVLSGEPKACILEEAERVGADLIVVGARGCGGVMRLLLGSVSEAVATHAHCSVEIVRGAR